MHVKFDTSAQQLAKYYVFCAMCIKFGFFGKAARQIRCSFFNRWKPILSHFSGPGAKMASHWHLVIHFKPFADPSPKRTKMLKISLLEASWGHLAAKPQKCSKSAFWGASCGHFAAKPRKCSKSTFWGLPGAIWRPSPENAQNQPSEGVLGPFCGRYRPCRVVRGRIQEDQGSTPKASSPSKNAYFSLLQRWDPSKNAYSSFLQRWDPSKNA